MPWDTPQEVKDALEQVGMVEFLRDNAIPDSLGAALSDGNWEVILHQYAASEYSTENLDFLRSVAAFENSGDLDLAAQIYQYYVMAGAPQQVNLGGPVREDLDGMFGEGGTGFGPPSLFDSAKNEIMRMTSNDTFARFKAKAKSAQDALGAEVDWENVEGRERS
jgi:regulator of G protein signaling-like protein